MIFCTMIALHSKSFYIYLYFSQGDVAEVVQSSFLAVLGLPIFLGSYVKIGCWHIFLHYLIFSLSLWKSTLSSKYKLINNF